MAKLITDGEVEALAFEVEAGDALCFNARVVHGSSGNPEGRILPHNIFSNGHYP